MGNLLFHHLSSGHKKCCDIGRTFHTLHRHSCIVRWFISTWYMVNHMPKCKYMDLVFLDPIDSSTDARSEVLHHIIQFNRQPLMNINQGCKTVDRANIPGGFWKIGPNRWTETCLGLPLSIGSHSIIFCLVTIFKWALQAAIYQLTQQCNQGWSREQVLALRQIFWHFHEVHLMEFFEGRTSSLSGWSITDEPTLSWRKKRSNTHGKNKHQQHTSWFDLRPMQMVLSATKTMT